ncbi:Hsp70 suppressor, GTPase facilitates ribosomal subunit dissociation [Cadophora gregata]|uniref:Hsp70 suppressor, GTPase facilitates ribosomal subunit dissociation n=1 Tax=Cadophora gregata TaxID=51156 RepID=UPI0026DB01E3|nr:Hsp70 suppressor, GTPase facilitates ribosomal subunit dissociation [Cadophora gregata]KAK0120257.1 Hsp70 suppressor, GTPase facilitates ribosomal subunit dissociation [Cadophora gregata]
MRVGTIAVRAELPATASHITDKQIQEALWHYYYDIEKSVGYLVSTYVAKKEKKEKKVKDCSTPFSNADFFKDMPWLNAPQDRQAVFIPPLYPRGGLPGGSSDGAPKMSKLQALAAARKKKAQEQKSSESSGVEKPLADLTLNLSSGKEKAPTSPTKSTARGFPIRKRKDSNPHEKAVKPTVVEREPEPMPDVAMEDAALDQAEPSAFANTMFSSNSPTTTTPRPYSSNLFSLPYTSNSAVPTTADPFAGPSPDDVVIAAQSKAKGGSKGPPKTSNEKKADQIANGVEAVKLDDTPRARSKNLDVLSEFEKAEKKNAANFVVIGHVDAGKSTLMGRLLYDLKVVDQRTMDRYKKEAEKMGKSSFALAWVLDQGTEERSRGVTIDIATNKFETDKTSFTILDAPGHRDFIPNMIAGAAQADFAVLVVDASTGSFESGLKGQTKEHALLVRSMGVQRIIIAINKLDTVSWSQDRFLEIQNQVSAFLTAAGFQPKNVSFIPCSGLLGDNIAKKSTEKDLLSWYDGPTLVEELENSEPITRALTKPLRLTIGDIFRGGVQNPLSISGRIEAGSLQTGDALLAQPSSQKCFIKALELDNETVDWAVAGQNVTVHLSGIEEQYLKVGDVLCSPSSPIQNIKEFTAKVLAFEFLTPGSVDVHRGRMHAPGRVDKILGVLDKVGGTAGGGGGGEGGKGDGGGKKKKVRIVKPGQVARVRVIFEGGVQVPLEAGARVVLRSGGETVAAGLLE